MNAAITYKSHVTSNVLDELARQLPSIIADALHVPGGRLAIVTPEQVSLEFSEASGRDVGADLRIMVFAKNNDFRESNENDLAKEILGKILAAVTNAGVNYSVDVRLYLMTIGAAEHSLG